VNKAARALRRCGYEFIRQTGSQIIPRREHRTVPQHKLIKPGTLKGLMEQAGLTVKESVAQF
jgi:predicted RNA binding protein YcfA (HicA-like mRNA interferase family)